MKVPTWSSLELKRVGSSFESLLSSPEVKKVGRSFGGFWPEAWRDLKHDFRTTKWLRGLGWYGLLFWTVGLVGVVAFLSILFAGSGGACLPDDSFQVGPETYSYWDTAGFFQITLGFGHLTFTQAKAIDIIWDVVFGRGGQALLAFISWRVFARYVTVCMEVEPVTFRTFRAIFIHNEASVFAIFGLIKDFGFRLRLHSRVAMVFMITTMIFILAFPTLGSAMTGYTSNVQSFVPDQDRNLVQFSSFERALYIIHDGWRINQDANYVVKQLRVLTDPVMDNYDYDKCGPARRLNLTGSSTYDDCWLQSNVSNYVAQYGLNSSWNTTSTFMEFNLSAPVLNISAFRSADNSLSGYNSTKLQPETWVWSNNTYNKTYIGEHGSCQTTGDYKWGFSFMQLFLMIVFLFLWTHGVYLMWLRAHFTMRLRGRIEVAGEHKAIILLADAMREQLQKEKAEDISLLKEENLEYMVNKDARGGRICFEPPILKGQKYSFRRGTWGWFKKQRWWCLTFLVFSVIMSVSWIATQWMLYWSIGPVYGTVFAMQVGSTDKSRTLLVLSFSVLTMLIVVPFAIMEATMWNSY